MGHQKSLEVHYLPSNFGRKVKITNFGLVPYFPPGQTRIQSVEFIPKPTIQTAQTLAYLVIVAKELTNLAHSKPIDSTVRRDYPNLVSLIKEAVVESKD